MKNHNEREWTKEDYKRNGNKNHTVHSKNDINYTIEKPGINESGIIAKKKGF